MSDPTTTLQLAQRAEGEAKAVLDLERQRVAQGEQEVQSLQAQLQLENPDKRQSFQRLVAALGDARLRLEALRDRVPLAEEALRTAGENLAVADREAARAQLAEFQAQHEREASELVFLAAHLLDEFNARHADFLQKARTDEVETLQRRAGESLSTTDPDRWAGLSDAVASVERLRAHEAADRAYVESGRAARDAAARAARSEREMQELDLQRIAGDQCAGDLDQVDALVGRNGVHVDSRVDVSVISTRSVGVCDAE